MANISKKTVQKNLRKFRKEKGFTMLRLAVDCSLSESFIGDIERGRAMPSIETLLKIARVLDVEAHKFFLN